ncbi:integrase arm-type DNA-binding domain-containing protein [Paraburkholderia sp. B3]|uniref:integrase arm-type DNA-binding domain-containing protein n=1 Tax=Paraburkholderia sp. B3 TaxID=3134791 RepID=UPI0039824698
MARVNFTAARVRDFCCPPGARQVFLWDSGAPGLALRATPGSVSYIFQGRIAGRTIRTTIGDTRVWDIDRARHKARELQQLIDDGRDPRVEKAAAVVRVESQRVELARRERTLDEAWSVYVEAHRTRWSERHTRDHEKVVHRGGEERKRSDRKTVPGVLASLLDTPLAELDSNVIAGWLARESPVRATQAALAFRLLRACLNWCAEQPDFTGLAPEQACGARAVRRSVPKKRARTDCLQREQLKPWFGAACKLDNPVIAAYLQALLLTGARREELGHARHGQTAGQPELWSQQSARSQ